MINVIYTIAQAITGTRNWILKILITLLLIVVVVVSLVLLPIILVYLTVRKLFERSVEW